jgi:beta-galactosidase
MLVRSSTRISLGAAYYAEYQAAERLDVDLDLMASAGLNVVRVGESVWSKWEPEDGVFSLDWMTRILDGALARGIGVILGTPTYAIPPWLARKHPELAIRRRDGRRIGWGARQEANFTDPLFRSYAERIIRAILAKFSHHPAVVGYQVDNEPGLEVIYNENVFEDFKASLRSQFESVDALNAAWGLTYWSHELSDWDDLWPPEGNSSPQYDLSWREFQARITHEFIDWEASIVREYCAPEQFVTTCLAYSRPSLNDFEINSTLDVASGNAYFGMQDHLDFESDLAPIEPWASTGPWGLELQADRMYSSKQARFLVTETNAATVGSAHRNFPPYDGQLEQAGVLLLARGARMIEYWHWHSLPFGAETYWGGVLPHNGVPGRIYKEVKAFGDKLAAFGDLFDGFRPDADIGVIYSNASKWALEFQPPIALADGTADRNSYNRIFQAFYRGFSQHGVQARLVHAEQLEALSPSELVDRHPVLLAPAL